ncbi:tRNA cytosine32 2-sulfurtransferase [Campylobacter blaseri]|uniref:tRNA 2-thiocytidine(32) synthetase TtcA n=1 Tax=Campylobacter blaseri TaxID=2042961 RepID=A0A2P8QZA9_9BACT|nr:ATP-binding protein [Campylobacter blaseri]PSM51588.1 tRNA 2-thiocytidine(32) synthetase TtcA [Campylobacter blaseri]PSM53381.1 tRNA 2-thiocytidine(32) synthetase TtcA [Campylobacter blaseri]QKF86676.1 tRNA cytosine32 2-sulfurtransferase [Campylobacter blaseri]
MINLSKKLMRIVGQTNAKYSMFEEGDKILLGLSGGKDSLVLAHLLNHFQKVSPNNWTFKAVTLGYGVGEDFSFLINHCKEHNIPHDIINSNIFEISKEKMRKNTSICSFCSRMRRGYLYTYALENGFNKLALGHHFDDAAESFFMNFTHNGSLRTLPPKYTAENGLKVIRPLILVRERQLIDCAKNNELTVSTDEDFCPATKGVDIKMPTARAQTKKLLHSLEEQNPKLFISLKSSFENIHKDTFFNIE